MQTRRSSLIRKIRKSTVNPELGLIMAAQAAAINNLPEQLSRDFRALNLPVFDGYRTSEARNWANHCDGKMAALQIPNARAVLLFQGLFTGTALDWYRELPAVIKNDYEALKLEFRRRWVTRDGFHQQNITDQFYGAQQAEGQLAKDFADELLQLSYKAVIPRDDVLKKFWSSLSPTLKQATGLIARPVNLETAVSVATQAETMQKQQAVRVFPIQETDRFDRLEHAIFALTETVADQRRSRKEVQFQDNSRPASPGPNRRRYEKSPSRGGYRGRPRMDKEVTCYNCGEKNHMARFCLAQRKDEATPTPAPPKADL